MPTLSTMTLAELQASTKAQIITSIRDYLTANYTRRQLIQLLRDRDTEWDTPTMTYRKDGQIERQTETIRDVETGALISTKTITWTYYETGEVDEIIISETDADGKKLSQKKIKHYKDGKQPEAT